MARELPVPLEVSAAVTCAELSSSKVQFREKICADSQLQTKYPPPWKSYQLQPEPLHGAFEINASMLCVSANVLT